MRVVAVDAGDTVVVVVVAMPAEAGVVCMTAEAGAVLGLDRIVDAEGQERRRPFLAAAHGMRPGRAVTGLALQLAVAERAVRIVRVGVGAAEHRQHLLVGAVARETRVGAAAAVLRFVLADGGPGGQDT
jgi:hypothetical protein